MKLIQLSKNKILYLLIILVIILIPQNNFSDDSLNVNNISKNLRFVNQKIWSMDFV